MEAVKKWASFLYLQYEIITCLALFEPWERIFIREYQFVEESKHYTFYDLFTCLLIFLDTAVLGVILVLSVSSYLFLPNYLSNLVRILGLASDSPDTGFQPIAS